MLEWRQIPGLPRYEISEDGQIRDALTGRAVPSHRVGGGYLGAHFYVASGERVLRVVHRLVAMAFIGPPPTPAHQACHNDGSRRNNHHTNLRWDTCAGNLADRYQHGTMTLGRRNGRARLSIDQVQEVRRLRESGLSFAKIGARFGVSKRQAMRVVRGEHWGWAQ